MESLVKGKLHFSYFHIKFKHRHFVIKYKRYVLLMGCFRLFSSWLEPWLEVFFHVSWS